MPAPAVLAKLPKPVLMALYGAAGGLLGALVFGEPLWAALRPPPPPPPPPVVGLTLSPSVQVYQGKDNGFTVQVAAAGPDATAPVEVRFDGLPAGVEIPPITVRPGPGGAAEAEARVRAAPGAPAGRHSARAVATLSHDGASAAAEAAVAVEVTPEPVPAVDVMFAVDVSGSMQYAIDGVKRGVTTFATELGRQKLDLRVGLVAFCHYQTPPQLNTLRFDGEAMTGRIAAFRDAVGALRAFGGGDPGESSLDGVAEAARQKWRADATRVVILITDEPPAVPDARVKSVAEAAAELDANRIEQLHIVTLPNLAPIFTQLQGKAKGRVFDLDAIATGRDSFDRLMPEMGRAIADAARAARPEQGARAAAPPPAATVRGVQSSEGFAAGSSGRLTLAIATWTGAIAGLVCLALMAGQYHYLRSSLPPVRPALVAAAGGLAAGLAGGAAGQGLFLLAPDSAVLDKLLRVFGWAVLGGLAGVGLSFFIPNMRARHGLAGGAGGGAAGAVGFLLVSALGSDPVGRVVGGALLGFCIGLMVAVVEAAFRRAWLEVWHGPREMILVNLGPEPVRVGGDNRQCTVWARGAAPVALKYWVRDGRVVCQDVPSGREQPVADGFEQSAGPVRVVVRTTAGEPRPSAADPAASGLPPPTAPAKSAAPKAAPAADPWDDLPAPVAARPAAPRPVPPPAPKPAARVELPAPAAAAPAAKPSAARPAADPGACPFCRNGTKHPGKPGSRYCLIHDQYY